MRAFHFLLLSILLIQCTSDPSSEVTPETVNQRIARIIDRTDIGSQYYLNGLRAESKMATFQQDRNNLQVLIEGCKEMILAGQNEAAVVNLETMLTELRQRFGEDELDNIKRVILPILAMGYWRMAEQSNCLDQPNPEACIIPFTEKGRYQDKVSAKKAIEIYLEILQKNPNDWNTVWLLNIAHMAIGTYPNDVPKQYLISPTKFESETSFPRFNNIAPQLDIATKGTAGASIVDDFNNDNILDLFVSSWGYIGKCHMYLGDGKGGFTDATAQWNLDQTYGGLNAIQGDYDNDGYLDLLIMRGAWVDEGALPHSLLKNNKGKGFIDVTLEAGLYSEKPGQAGVWRDFNNDGFLDLFLGFESKNNRLKNTKDQYGNELWVNNGDGTFSELLSTSGITEFDYTKGVSSADYNKDGKQDILLSNLGEPNVLYKNVSSGQEIKFKRTSLGIEKPIFSFPCWFFDFNQDGWEDIFIASFFNQNSNNNFSGYVAQEYLTGQDKNERARLYINKKGKGFEDVTEKVGLATNIFAMGSNYGDINYDGYPDMYLGTGEPNLTSMIPNRMFLNVSGQKVTDISYAGGFAHIQKGHGVSFADFDNDGDQDVHTTLGGAFEGDVSYNALFENPGSNNSFISLQLKGAEGNSAAIGAHIEVKALKEDGRKTSFFSTVSSGGSFGGNPLRREIGLGGSVNKIASVKITWPGETTQENFEELNLNSFYQITKGGAPVQLEL